jgi:hypothetical protein
MAAAGLYFDVRTLTVAGIILFGLAAVLWLYEWGRTAPRKVAPAAATKLDEPPPYNPMRAGLSNALIEVSKARSYARDAYGNRRPNLQSTISSVESALATVRRTFDLETPPATGHGRTDLKLWMDYFDVVWPFIRSGNYEEAKERAAKFVADHKGDGAA